MKKWKKVFNGKTHQLHLSMYHHNLTFLMLRVYMVDLHQQILQLIKWMLVISDLTQQTHLTFPNKLSIIKCIKWIKHNSYSKIIKNLHLHLRYYKKKFNNNKQYKTNQNQTPIEPIHHPNRFSNNNQHINKLISDISNLPQMLLICQTRV